MPPGKSLDIENNEMRKIKIKDVKEIDHSVIIIIED